MAYLGSWKIDDWITLYCNTHRADTGAATDADAAPTYRIYEDETAPPIATGNLALLDAANTTGFYSERIQLLAATGFEKGKQYCAYIEATVNGVTGTIHHTFQMEAEVDANTVSPTVSADVVSISGDAGAADNLETACDGGAYNIGGGAVVAASVSGAVGSVTGDVGGNVVGSVASVVGDVGGNVVGSVGSVVGAVGSVTGDVGGNVVGSVASVVGDVGGNVTGSVGSVIGAVGSVTGDVGGNVVGSVGSVVGAVGSVTGDVGGNVIGSVGSVVGAVGSVAGNVGGNVTGSVGSVVGAVGSVTGNVGGNVTGSVGSVAAGGVAAASFAAGAIDSAAIAADAITSSELAASAVQEIADGVWDEAIAGHLGAGSTGAALNGASAPTAGQVADAVWDEAIAGHLGAGSTGEKLNSISAAVFPAGAVAYTYTVSDSVTGLPIPGVEVWFSTDIAGANVIWKGNTDSFGVARDVLNNLPALNAGTYYIFRKRASYTFDDPDTEIVS